MIKLRDTKGRFRKETMKESINKIFGNYIIDNGKKSKRKKNK